MQTPQRSTARGGSASRNSRGRNGGPGRTGRLRGLFDGIWHCDCDPRLPAEQFKVKKEGPNKGRDFYTCQQSPESKRCGFFLWAEEARPREAAAVLGNGRRERDGVQVQEGWSAGRRERSRDRTVRFAPSPSPSPTPAARPNLCMATVDHGMKRSSRQAGFEEDEEDDDDDDEYGLTREDEEELAAAVFQTPQKPQSSNIGVYATPSSERQALGKQRTPRRLPWLEESVTPVSTKKSIGDYFATPSKQREEVTEITTVTYPELPSTPAPREEPAILEPTSPSPAARFKDSLANSTEDTLTKDVFKELSSIQLPKATIERLRSILTKHDLKTHGIKMGRDVSRSALQKKEERVKELEERVRVLEQERNLRSSGKRRRHEIVVHQDEEDGEETDVEL